MTINEAKDIIAAEAKRLTWAIRAKGFDKASIEIWIGCDGREGTCTAFIQEHPMHVGYSRDLEAMIAEIDAKIAALPHKDAEALAYADELSQPLYLRSEHLAKVAE